MPRGFSAAAVVPAPLEARPELKTALVDVDNTLIRLTDAGVRHHDALLASLSRFAGKVILFSHYSMQTLRYGIIKKILDLLACLSTDNATQVATIMRTYRDMLRTSVSDEMRRRGIDVAGYVYHSTPHRSNPTASIEAIHRVERGLATVLTHAIDLLEGLSAQTAIATVQHAINADFALFLADYRHTIESHSRAETRALRQARADEIKLGIKGPMLFHALTEAECHRRETIIFDDHPGVAAMAERQGVRCCLMRPEEGDWSHSWAADGFDTMLTDAPSAEHPVAAESVTRPAAPAAAAMVLAQGHGAPPPEAKVGCWCWCC